MGDLSGILRFGQNLVGGVTIFMPKPMEWGGNHFWPKFREKNLVFIILKCPNIICTCRQDGLNNTYILVYTFSIWSIMGDLN